VLKYLLPKAATRAITQAVSAIFARGRKRFLGLDHPKGIVFGVKTADRPAEHRLDLSLKGIFDASAHSEGMLPNAKLYESVQQGVLDYFDAHEKLAHAKVLNAVQSYLHDADLGSAKADPEKVLGKVLEETFKKVTSDVEKVVNTETNKAKNMSTLEAISKISAINGVEDPVVFFAGPIDGHTCKDCLRLFFLPDRVTPRVWKTSELKSGYFKKGDSCPCIAGGHINCRHSLSSVMPGYGFKGGRLTYIEPGFDVFKEQRG